MAGEDTKKKKSKKRSANVVQEVQSEPSKIPRLIENEAVNVDMERSSPWKNLELILSLQDKNIDLLKKVDLAFDYVKSSTSKETDDTSGCSQVINTSRTLVFLNNWIQSVMISSEKKMRLEERKPEFETPGSCLDIRCWKVLHFCLVESKNLHVSLTCLRDFLRVIRCIAIEASSFLSLCHEGTLSTKQVELYAVVLDCISLVFSFHGGVSNENLELWILLTDKMLELILKIYTEQIDDGQLGTFVLQFACCLLEPFAMFLRLHPTRKNGFRDFIDKLIEPLLHLLYVLHSSSRGCNVELRTNLSKLVEEVVAQGLFHPTHIDGFLNSPSTGRYKNSSDSKEEKLVNKSYHRHLFDKVEKIVVEKNGLALVGLGEMLHLFVSCVTKHKGASVGGGNPGQLDASYASLAPINPSHSRKLVSEKSPGCINVVAELRKSIFCFFVRIMEYLLADVNKYLQSDREEVSILFNVPSTLRSINNLLDSFIYEKVYLRTEDTSEGASKEFLRLIYRTVISFSTEITHLQTSPFGSDEESDAELFIHLRKELIVAINHLLNIEYEVVGDDLESLWTMVFSSLTCSYSSVDVLDQPLLSLEIHRLACKLIDLYSELRQVNSSIFALFRAVRHSASLHGDSESCTPSPTCSSYSNSLSMLLCSLEFRLSLSNAIKSIPEGQAAGLIRRLSSDIKESLEWVKFEHQMASVGETAKSSPHNCDLLQLNLRANLLGRVLCEVYTIILDSITVSSGNSYPFGVALKNFIDIICPCLSSLVSLRPNSDGIKEFSAVVDGKSLDKRIQSKNVSTCWILVFFFRLLLSCKCLYRLAISLMPPDASKKLSGVTGDSFTAHTGRDWLEMSGCADGGYFSWISHPSAPLLNVIRSVSDIYIQDSIVICPPLAYVLHAMALQRLVDLNRLIKSSEYMLQWNQTPSQTNLKDDGDLSSYQKRTRKWKKCVSKMREEAATLTNFMLGFFSSVVKDQISNPSFEGGIVDTVFQGMNNNDTLNFAVGSLDEKLLPLTLWRIICQNVDIWCFHAAKKDLKNFLTLLIQASLSCDSAHEIHNLDKRSHLIALEFLSNTIPYEQKFISRYMASRFCKILQKSVKSIFASSGVDVSKSPDWVELMSAVENLSDVKNDPLTGEKPCMVPAKPYSTQANLEFSTCQCLLGLLMWMPEEYLSSRSSSLYITCILNLERLLVGSMLGLYRTSCSQSPYDLFRLFVSCRRVLKVLTVASCKKTVNGCQSPLTSRLSESSFPLSWLLKSLSAVIGFQHALPEDIAFETKVAILSLMDNTSNVLLTVSRDQFERRISSVDCARKLRKKRKSLDPVTEESDLSGNGLKLKPKNILGDCKSVLQLATTLEEYMQNSLATFKDAPLDKKVECLAGSYELNKLSSIISCFQGLLGGLAFALSDTNALKGNTRINFSSYNAELMTIIDSSIATCISCLTFLLKAFFLEDDLTLITRESSSGACDVSSDASSEGEIPSPEKIVPSDRKCSLVKCDLKKNFRLAIPDLEVFLTEVQHMGECLNKPLLLKILGGENPEAAFFCRQLFIACSAILRLNSLIDLTSISWGLFPIVVAISQFVLSEFSSRSEMPHLFDFCWLDGVVKFLEVLGSYFPQIDPLLSRDLYVKLVDLHIRAIGKCISLQGKEAKLASQETGSHSKMLTSPVKQCFSLETSRLGEFKAKLRMSFRTYIRESSELHLLSAIQAVERALVGVQEGLITNYEILCGSSDGGEVSSVVAAGIDCLDSILGFVTEHKSIIMIKRHIQSFVACLFNIIVHLQAPCIFYGHVDSIKGYIAPDSGSVISMCIEILTTISGKSSFFIDACHIAQSLRVPGALFQYFLQLQFSESPVKASVISTSNIVLDRKFSIELYAGCCRLLCSALKHHKNETWHSLALLQDSVSVLLHCLEIVNTDPLARRDIFAWEVQEAVKCASNLRRVYEEVRQQKDVFGHTSFQFLSRYIWVYCGFGPAKRGIIREIDEALKPGIYALIDSCSADDLQLLHTLFGEGPCRSTLSNLQHDYKLKFQYGGKV
ncbi:hypothetical protein ACJIZ3_015343 [Penstemon smallii]|uniref:Nucleolar 27S pre-rRNA processing Urb2/Npa2 C-terminal domain-containing protein n=1 Tax=Penstemon smallii TaxID=265156 RepID=A0ABD3RMD2_9LAMI